VYIKNYFKGTTLSIIILSFWTIDAFVHYNRRFNILGIPTPYYIMVVTNYWVLLKLILYHVCWIFICIPHLLPFLHWLYSSLQVFNYIFIDNNYKSFHCLKYFNSLINFHLFHVYSLIIILGAKFENHGKKC
jgi:hypothetical protein